MTYGVEGTGRTPPKVPRRELAPGIVFLAVSTGLLVAAQTRNNALTALKPLLFQLSAVGFVAAAGFVSAALITMAARRGPLRRPSPLNMPTRALPGPLETVRQHIFRVLEKLRGIDWLGGWLPAMLAVLLALAAMFALVKGWRNDGTALPAPRVPWAIGGMVALCFPLLVLERRFAAVKLTAARDAKSLAYLLRLTLFSLMGLSLAQVLRWFALPFATPVEHGVLLFIGAVALELRDVSAGGQGSAARLDGVSLALRQGEITGLAGVSGNGQATLAALIAGTLKPAAGEIVI